jgi:hypothetical protein
MHADMQHCTCMLLHLLADAKNKSKQQRHQWTGTGNGTGTATRPTWYSPVSSSPPVPGKKGCPPHSCFKWKLTHITLQECRGVQKGCKEAHELGETRMQQSQAT